MIQKRVCLCIILGLSVLLAGCSRSGTDDSTKITRLEQENAALCAQVDSLTAQINTLNAVRLDSWELAASAGKSADEAVAVLFSAVPAVPAEGQEATLEVTLDGRVVDSIPCLWDGSAYTAYLSLTPADGYGYYCLLSCGDSLERITLSTVDYPQKPVLTFLKSGMQRYCNLVVDNWYVKDGSLILSSATGSVQLPLLEQQGQTVQCTKAQLILQKNGVPVQTKDAALSPGDTQGSSYVVISDAAFLLPSLNPEDQLDLWLDISLTTGEVLSSPCVSWYPTENGLELAVG